MHEESQVWTVIPEAEARDLKKVPFVEMAEGRLQGVISSGSDADRVYVSFFQRDTHNFYCSTNNNRPCGGLRGAPCKHLMSLVDEALLQYGAARVIRFLGLDLPPEKVKKGRDLMPHLKGMAEKEPAATVFSRFLTHLTYLQQGASNEPLPELNWFTGGRD